MYRLDTLAKLELLRQGTPASAGSRVLDLSLGTLSFPADGAPWGERDPCLVWQVENVDLASSRDFGGIAVWVNDHRSGEHNFHISFLSRTATVPLVPEQSMKYIIEPDMSARPDNDSELPADSLTLVFPDLKEKNDVELVSVEILSKIANYRSSSSGHGYESLHDENRPVFYQWTDGAAAWSVTIPEAKSTLNFGTGLLPNSSPIDFSVSVERDDSRKELFRETISTQDTWIDHVIDLGDLRGEKARLVFTAESTSSAVALWSSPRIAQAERRGKFVCVYLVDALRPDFCEGFGTFRGVTNSTPAIQSLAERAVRFTNALANAPLTKYSMPTLFSGLYPSHTGIMTYQRVPNEIWTLAEAFQQNGFLTASFLFNPNSGRLRGLHQGFDHLFSPERLLEEAKRQAAQDGKEPSLNLLAASSASIINETLFNFIRAHRHEDMFLFVHLMDPHSPYLPDEEFLDGFKTYMSTRGMKFPPDREALLEELRNWARLPPADRLPDEALLELYRGAVETADKHLRRFLQFLETEDMLKGSTFVLTADHGEHLNEHPEIGAFKHMHPMLLEVLRIPLIIKPSGNYIDSIAGRSVSEPVQLADLMPTLLDLTGIGYDPARFDGASLLALMAGRQDEYFAMRPIISQSRPYWSVFLRDIHTPDITASHAQYRRIFGSGIQVYDVDLDPREHNALKGPAAQKLIDELVESLSLTPRRVVSGAETIVNDEETLKQLKALGYID